MDGGPSRKFFVLGLPRSRTAWLSHFLTYGDWRCGHEELRHVRSLDDVRSWLSQPCTGSAETAAAPFWRLITRMVPDARIVIVRRKPEEVFNSMLRIPGVSFDRERLARTIRRLDRKLDQVQWRMQNVLSVRYEDLSREEACASIFEHCLPYKHDKPRWEGLANINIQADFLAMMRYFIAFQPQMEKVALIAKHQMLAAMAIHEPARRDGMTFQCESFDAWERDGAPLFEAHCVMVEEAPGNWKEKNIPFMRGLYEKDGMQIMTARCNGRMFGYLMTLLTPSMASPHLRSAVHTTFFASPEFPGLGIKLQRAALAKLKEMGIDEVFMQAGTRGSGARLGTLYRRLGGEYNGTMFRIDLSEA